MSWHHIVFPPNIFFISSENYNNTIAAAPQSQIYLLEEEAVPGYIQFAGHLAQGGRNYSWNQVKSTDGESINS